jgi:hypothetical protein
MGMPYRARVDERWFLDLPGINGEDHIFAYVEDTSECAPRRNDNEFEFCDEDCSCCPRTFGPRIILEVADWENRVRFLFRVDSEAQRANSLHKVDTLIATLRVFRAGLVAEFAEYDRRERELRGGKG